MRVLTIKAKAGLAAEELDKLRPYGITNVDIIRVIEKVFITDVPAKPKYTAAAFSGIVGCGVFPIGSLKPVCVIPPQAPAHLKDLSKEKLIDGHLGDIKLETERIARIVCSALNEA